MPLLRPTTQVRLQQFPLLATLATLTLAITWLLPNLAQPWLAFHKDAWAAMALACAMLGLGFRLRIEWAVSRAVIFLLLISLVPWLQHWGGLIPLRGDAFMSFAYVLGFALAVAVGENWTRIRPTAPVDFVLGAAAIAALISVGLQLYQMASLAPGNDPTDIWVLRFNPRDGRPYANLAQPNQLATLLVWGLIGFFWMRARGWIRHGLMYLPACILLMGIALTQSRTAMLTLTLFFGVCFFLFWKKLISRSTFRDAVLLFGFFWVALVGVYWISHLLDIGNGFSLQKRTLGETRFFLWRVAADAVAEHPWLGYGWRHTHEGLIEVFPRHPQMANWYFEQAHNLFLDLVLWCGLPLGLLVSGLMLYWLAQHLRQAATPQRRLVLAAVLAVSIHAMLELPLHYAYFLLPTGLLAGYLNQTRTASNSYGSSVRIPRIPLLGIMMASCLVLVVIVYDYLRVEARFEILQFELKRIGKREAPPPDDLLILDQWGEMLRVARAKPNPGLSAEELERWEAVALFHPSELTFQKLMFAWSLNGHPERAKYWADRLCLVSPPRKCARLLQEWRENSMVMPVASEPGQG